MCWLHGSLGLLNTLRKNTASSWQDHVQRCCLAGIADVSILQLTPNLEVLSLSANQISSLSHFAFCGQLKQLYLRANAVADLAELR